MGYAIQATGDMELMRIISSQEWQTYSDSPT